MVTRCSNNYGPRQFPEKLIPLFVTNLFDGKKVPLYGDGLNVRDWLFVDDHCRGILLVFENGRAGEIYNIGGGTELTNVEITRALLELCGADESMIEPVEDRLGHDRRYCVDWGKIREELGYRPEVDFDEGLARTVKWYRENESWWRPLKERAVNIIELSIPGAYVLDSAVWGDERGFFREWFKRPDLDALGISFAIEQANLSMSAPRRVARPALLDRSRGPGEARDVRLRRARRRHRRRAHRLADVRPRRGRAPCRRRRAFGVAARGCRARLLRAQ